MDWNEFPPIFQKVQHSHSRHHKTTSNLLRIDLKGILKFNEILPLEGAMYITLYSRIFGGIPKMVVLCNFCRNWRFQTNIFTGLLELIQLYKQNPLEKFFIFTIYQNYTLALSFNDLLFYSRVFKIFQGVKEYSKIFFGGKLSSGTVCAHHVVLKMDTSNDSIMHTMEWAQIYVHTC